MQDVDEEITRLIRGNEYEFEVIRRLTGEDRGKVKGNFIKINTDSPYQYTKPIVLCLDGNGNTNLKNANGFAKAIENTAYIKNEVDVISVRYRPLDRKETKTTGTLNFEDIKKIVDCFFVPLITDNGKRLSITKVKQNLRKITIFSYCYGVKILNDINIVLKSRMVELGYKEDKINQILKCLINVCYAPYTENHNNTNLYIKSFDDDFFGEKYRLEAKKKIEDLPKKEQNKFYVKNLLYVGNGVVFNDKDFNLYAQNLNGSVLEVEDDHLIGSIVKDYKGNILSDKDNIHSHTISKCLTLMLRTVIMNSIENESSFKQLDIKEIEKQCNSIISKANANETEIIKRNVLKQSLTIVPVEEALKIMGITEKDFLTRKVTFESVNKSFIGRIDYSNTIFEKIKNIKYRNLNARTKEFTKKNIVASEIILHKKGIVTKDGELILLGESDTFESINLAMLLNRVDPIGSVKYMLKRENGKDYLYLSDNYGSRYVVLKDTFNSLICNWQQEYADNKLTVQLNDLQKTVLKNLCVFFNTSTNNIVYDTEKEFRV